MPLETLFEPTEKRLSVRWTDGRPDLRQIFFAEALVREAGAQILSHLKTQTYDLFLLSESTLMVSETGFTLITCGKTTLSNAAAYLLKSEYAGEICHFSFSRQAPLYKNKNCSFKGDQKILEELFLSELGIGNSKLQLSTVGGFNYLTYLNENKLSMNEKVKRVTFQTHAFPLDCPVSIRHSFGTNLLKRGWRLDDFIFSPWGYSLNACRGNDYLILHVSRANDLYFVSLEANCDFEWLIEHWSKHLPARINYNVIQHDTNGKPVAQNVRSAA